MALQNINVGIDPGDQHDGDKLRDAFIKVNNDFQFLLTKLSDYTTTDELNIIIGSIQLNLNDLQTQINGKAPLVHTHTISQVVGLQNALNAMTPLLTFNTAITQINADIVSINSLIADLIQELHMWIDTFQAEQLVQDGRLDAIEAVNDTQSDDIDALETRVDELELNVENLFEGQAEQDILLDDHGNRITTLENRANVVDIRLDAINQIDDAQDIRINDIEDDIQDIQDEIDAFDYIPNSEKAQPNGVATLDGNGKVPLNQINDALIGNVSFEGIWDALNNVPDLDVVGPKGNYYIANSSAVRYGIDWNPGDWIISDGDVWSKVDNTDSVTSVAGRTGNVILGISDVVGLTTSLSNKLTNGGDANVGITMGSTNGFNVNIIGNSLSLNLPVNATQGIFLNNATGFISNGLNPGMFRLNGGDTDFRAPNITSDRPTGIPTFEFINANAGSSGDLLRLSNSTGVVNRFFNNGDFSGQRFYGSSYYGNTFGNDSNANVSIVRNSVPYMNLMASDVIQFRDNMTFIGVAGPTYTSFKFGPASGAGTMTVQRNRADSVPVFVVDNLNSSSTGNSIEFRNGGTVSSGVRKDGRAFGTGASSSNDFVTLGQLSGTGSLVPTPTLQQVMTAGATATGLTSYQIVNNDYTANIQGDSTGILLQSQGSSQKISSTTGYEVNVQGKSISINNTGIVLHNAGRYIRLLNNGINLQASDGIVLDSSGDTIKMNTGIQIESPGNSISSYSNTLDLVVNNAGATSSILVDANIKLLAPGALSSKSATLDLVTSNIGGTSSILVNTGIFTNTPGGMNMFAASYGNFVSSGEVNVYSNNGASFSGVKFTGVTASMYYGNSKIDINSTSINSTSNSINSKSNSLDMVVTSGGGTSSIVANAGVYIDSTFFVNVYGKNSTTLASSGEVNVYSSGASASSFITLDNDNIIIGSKSLDASFNEGMVLTLSNQPGSIQYKTDNFTTPTIYTRQLARVSGTEVLSVNGQTADSSGNITISTSGATGVTQDLVIATPMGDATLEIVNGIIMSITT